MILNPLDHLLSNGTKVRLLRELACSDDAASGRDLARRAGIRSRAGLNNALSDLSELGLVREQTLSGVHLYRMNRGHDLAPPLIALFRAESERFLALRDALREAFESSARDEAVVSAVLFGSQARGDARAESDLDLLVVVHGADSVEPARSLLLERFDDLRERFGVRLAPLVMEKAEVRRRFDDGDPLIENVLRDGRTLLGRPLREVLERW